MSMSGMMTEALEMQRQMCDEAMNLVKQGTAMQNAQPPNVAGAEASLTRAVDIMEQALSIRYNSAEEKDAAERLNNKMLRYVKMIKSQRAKNQGGGAAGKRQMQKHNILELENLPEIYAPVMHLLHNSQALGDIFESLKQTFGFQESNALNQKEHLLLLLTNFKEQADSFDDGKKKKKKNKKMTGEEALEDYMRQRDPQQEMDLANKGIKRFHTRLFANYVKWCKYVSKKPAFTSDPLVDVSLFFLIWGEAGNFRQTPELLCFLLHSMLPQATSRDNKESGWFLANVIRPMYVELKRDNDKKTSKGERAPHAEIRNYDDFNEFFWSKKCLKYDIKTIGEAFANVDKKGRPKIVKKTYKEKRTWIRAVMTFRRIFFFNCALFLATLGFAMNMVLFCPDSPIMYGQDIQPLSETNVFEILGKKYAQPADTERVQTEIMEEEEGKPKCLPAKLATCLGVGNYNDGETFAYLPIDFRTLLVEVPFTNCLEKTSGRCACYHKLIDTCWSQADTAEEINEDPAEGEPSVTKITYDQSGCYPDYKEAMLKILDEDEGGYLNCGKCRIDINSLIKKPTRVVDLIMGLIDFGGRKDKGVMAMAGGVGALGLVIVGELVNRFSSGFSMGFVGRSLPVPMKVWCRYTCFWIVLLIIKLTFDYQFMMKALVEASLFIWNANEKDYLQYSAFMVQFSFHNIAYLFFLWIPAWMVFLYDAQIFYSILSVVVGSFAGFNMRIGELRSFRILRLTFKSIPGVFNKKIVPNIYEDLDQKKKKKANKKKKNVKEDVPMPERRFERISMSQGNKPLTVKAQKYSSLLEQRDDDVYNELRTPNGNDDDVSSQTSRSSNLGSITGVSGAEFERTIPFAMAWNRCLSSLREADVISDRELNVLSYLIDSKDTVGRKLYPPAFLTAGKLDESIDIVLECHALYDKLKTDKKKKDKTLQKIEVTMRERLLKDDLRIESILGSYKFSSQVLRILLGEEHKELDECYNFIEEMASHQQILKGLNLSNLYQCRAACAELMKAILEVPKKSTESSIKFQRSLYKVIDTVEAVVTCLKKVLGKQENLVQLLNDTPLKPNSFFFPADTQHYASLQLQKIVNDEAALDIVSRAYQLLTVDNFDAEPRSDEGRRRLRFFANSLFMDMPEAKPIRKIRSLTVSTPYYNEIVMYSVKDLTSQNDDSIKLLYYLQTIYPFEWENLLERLQVKDMNEALKKNPEEVQLWASYRGQTLARTTRGMMYNEDAIRFLHWLEIGENEPMHQAGCQCNKCVRLNEMVALKFNYVCTCQIYGRQKDEQRQQAQDIDFLLKKHPSLRVAYVDGPKKVKDGPPKFFSVLIRAMEDKIVEVYRVELPGDPIVGEGKPENQNHAVIFSRGELLQCIDMNQDGYLEEYLKMPNLLSTMDRHTDKAPLTIIGFREHVFTGGVSNLASFMSIQELNFVSLGQRMLAINHVRQHYGHPDIFDKLFAMSTGGTAKASKGVNLSEDIFAGFNSTLRGGYVSHEEFIQVGKGRDVGMQQLAQFEAKLSSGAGECVISRDALRMATRLDFFRLQSWFYGNLGWYFTQTLTVFGVYFFIYGKVYMALSGLDEYFLSRGGLGIGGVLNTSWAIQFGFLLVVPVVAVVGVEQGFRHGLTYLLWNVLTLGPIFFTFQMGTRMNYFDRTLLHGGAKYRATGRGFTIKHEKFAELFRFYAFSHFYRGVELLFLLLVFAFYGTFSWCNCSWRMESQFYSNIQPTELEWKKRCYANHYQTCVLPTNQNYGIMSFSLWIISATWMWAPFFFNPSGLDWDKIIEDYNDWQNWLRTTNDSAESWFGWWSNELAYIEHSSWGSRMVSLIRKSRFLAVAIGMYLQLVYNVYFERRDEAIKSDDKMLTFIFAGAIVVLMLLLVCCGYIASRVTKKMTMKQRKLRKMKFIISCICMAIALLSLTVLAITNVFEVIVIILMAAYWFMHLCILRGQSHHIAVRAMARAYDRAVGWIVFGPVMFVAMFLPFIGLFQQRVMFNNAFTSGLEVSKLFAHDVAPAQVVKVKRVSKKKKQRDD